MEAKQVETLRKKWEVRVYNVAEKALSIIMVVIP